MSQSDALVEQLKKHVATAEPVDADLSPLISEQASELVAALFALAPDDDLRDAWAEKVDFETADALGKIAWVASTAEDVEERIDQMFARGEAATLAQTLARAGVAWDHDALVELLDHDASRQAAALILAIARPEDVADWLDECEVVEEALAVLRAAALDVSQELEESFYAWEELLDGAEDVADEKARLDGVLAVLDPENYARRVLAGDSDVDWLRDLPVVADFLQVHGPTEWLEVLGILEATDDPTLELASLLAVCAAAGVGFEEPTDTEAGQLLELLSFEADADVEDWEPLATRLDLGFCIAVAPDEELGYLAVQVAAHERLTAFDIQSPGVPGLPLSANSPEGLNLEAASTLLEGIAGLNELPEATVLAVVRTLSDLRGLVAHDSERFSEHAEAWVDQFLDNGSAAIRLAVRQLLVALDYEAAQREDDLLGQSSDLEAALAFTTEPHDEKMVVSVLEEHAHLEGPLGLDCTRRLAAIATDASLEALARLWMSETVYRAPFYRDAFLEGVIRQHAR